MVNVTMKVDTRKFQRGLDELIAVKPDLKKLVKQQATLLVKDLVHLTPPFGGAPSTESYNAQRKVGEAAVKGDISKGFVALDQVDAMDSKGRAGKALRKAARERRWDRVLAILHQIGFKRLIRMEDDVTKDWHSQIRNTRGRVVRGAYGRNMVPKQRQLDRYIKTEQKRVGLGKAGWLKAAQMTGHGVPAWISRHGTSGGSAIKQETDAGIQFTFTNGAKHIQQAGRELRIVQWALDNRGKVMGMSARKLLEGRAAAARRKMA